MTGTFLLVGIVIFLLWLAAVVLIVRTLARLKD